MWVKQTQLPGSYLVVICCSRSTAFGRLCPLPHSTLHGIPRNYSQVPSLGGVPANTTSPSFNNQVMCQHPVKHSTLLLAIWSSPLSTMTNPCPSFRSQLTHGVWQFPDSPQLPCRKSIDTKKAQSLRHGFTVLSSLCFSNIIPCFPYKMAPRTSCCFLCTICMEEPC